jgi:hypothetical protein
MSTDTEDLDVLAFPMAVPELWSAYQSGMSLRDWFAGQALAALLGGRDEGCRFTVEEAADKSYALAQAMLVERQKHEEQHP